MRSTKFVLFAGLLIALLLAGVASFYASNEPDGLNRVAADHGLSTAQKDHSSKDSPLAGYETKGVDNGRLSGGLAGVAGALIVLTLAGGLTYAVKRRESKTS